MTTTLGSAVPLLDRPALDAARARFREEGRRVVLVPTMGALHEGHRALLREARRSGDAVVVSVFVNPLQFGPGEDLARYPRTWDADLAACREEGADAVYAPSAPDVYPEPPLVTVSAGPLGDVLEGASRPGHFDGVLTVVAKLFARVRPDVAVFGEKDWQQLTLVRRMVRDLDLGVDVVGLPTVRDPDGLALSSRNAYLSPEDRRAALALSAALRAGAGQAAAGRDAVLAAAQAVLAAEPAVDLDYLALAGTAGDGLDLDVRAGPARLLVAARVGATRLIDNLGLNLSTVPEGR